MFSNQQGPSLMEAKNFAVLKSEALMEMPSNRFTICGSIYIGYFRGYQVFFSMTKNDQKTLWFFLAIENQDINDEIYQVYFSHLEGGIHSKPTARLPLQPHAWSHACTTVDAESGLVMVVINGILIVNEIIKRKDFIDNIPIVFQNNLIIGAQMDMFGAVSSFTQSEASVSNVNIFSVPLTSQQMAIITTTGQFMDGDIVSWSSATWSFFGDVVEVSDEHGSQSSHFPHLYKMGEGFHRWEVCTSLCPRIQPGGRLPLTRHAEEARQLAKQAGHPDSNDWIWAPFRHQSPGIFSNMPPDLWVPGQPNGGIKQQCTFWKGSSLDGRLYDLECIWWAKKLQCLCQFDRNPLLRLRGLCPGSAIDTHFILMTVNGSLVFKGLTGTDIQFQTTTSEWMIKINLKNTTALTSADETSFTLGRHEWTIVGGACYKSKLHTRQLKMSACSPRGEFTCEDGQCVTMEQRCDQIANCNDKSDERNCQLLVTEEGYNRKVPPFTLRSGESATLPVQLYISIDLLKIVDMDERIHKIGFQFQIILEWRENNRVVYNNLKHDTSMNALSDNDIQRLWLPLVIYDNTDQKEATRLGMGYEWNTPITVIREGNFKRSDQEVVDETEIFKGGENTLFMQQVYTWQFQCKYDLKDYPFDTQVIYIIYVLDGKTS